MTDNRQRILNIVRSLIVILRTLQANDAFCNELTFTQFSILDYVSSRPQLEVRELIKLLQVEKSTATRLIEPLVVKGYVRKVNSPGDSRVVTLCLTSEGEAILEKTWGCIADFFTQVEVKLTGRGLSELEGMLNILMEASNCCVAVDACATEFKS